MINRALWPCEVQGGILSIRQLILAILQVASWLILLRVILSWVHPKPKNEILQSIIYYTDLLLAPLRAIIPVRGIDLSPILAWLLINLLMRWIAQTGA